MVDKAFLKSVTYMDMDFLDYMLNKMRPAINKIIEESRAEHIIGSSLEAEIDFYADDKHRLLLCRFEDELRYLYIVSRASVHYDDERPDNAKKTSIPGLWMVVSASVHPKCVRCYHRQRDVNLDPKYPDVCYRCIDNMTGKGEKRKYL